MTYVFFLTLIILGLTMDIIGGRLMKFETNDADDVGIGGLLKSGGMIMVCVIGTVLMIVGLIGLAIKLS